MYAIRSYYELDADNDGFGDACDGDTDGDGIPNAEDNWPRLANAGQVDIDSDGVGDACDNCVDVFNDDQNDLV